VIFEGFDAEGLGTAYDAPASVAEKIVEPVGR